MSFDVKILLTFLLVTLFKIETIKLLEISFYRTNNTVWLQEHHRLVIDSYFRSRQSFTTSALGSVLLKNKEYPPIHPERRNKTFNIILWEYHIDELQVIQSLEYCSVQNCIFHNYSYALRDADAVHVDLCHGKSLPSQRNRNLKQKWIFYSGESPQSIWLSERRLRRLESKFNWSMTYRTDSDIPVPYGRTIPNKDAAPINSFKLLSNLVPFWKNKTKTVLVAVMISNCGVQYRLDLVKELKKYVDVDFYGKCGDLELRRLCIRKKDCPYLRKYHFYLSFENSLCRQYITEKVFYNAYLNGAIPIIEGAPKSDCEKLLPPRSYIHIDNFPTAAAIAREIISLSEYDEKLLSYHVWRAHFEVTSECGYFGTRTSMYCRVCEALNYNSLESSYYIADDIQLFLEPKILCDVNYNIPMWKAINFTKT